MLRGRILLELIARNTLGTLGAGILLGVLYILLLVMLAWIGGGSGERDIADWLSSFGLFFFLAFPSAVPVAILFGAFLGAAAGIAGSILIVPVTLLDFSHLMPSSARTYRVALTGINVATALFTTLVLLPRMSLRPGFAIDLTEPTASTDWVLIPTLMAVVAAWWVSWRVARWYESEATAPGTSRPNDALSA